MKNLKQLTLDLCLGDRANFANFFAGNNEQVVQALTSLCMEESPFFIYFWGKSGSGKSHLLAALCQLFYEKGLSTAYLPLEDHDKLDPRLLDDLENLDLICIDGLHLIAGDLKWEEKIFHCFNNMLAHKRKVVVAANIAPHILPLKLLDLKSRMTGGLTFSLQDLDDGAKLSSLKMRAKLRGLELSDSVAGFLLRHYKRDTKSLFVLLEKLDKAALRDQRRLTIPFVKDILG